jgi:hypothetical protein
MIWHGLCILFLLGAQIFAWLAVFARRIPLTPFARVSFWTTIAPVSAWPTSFIFLFAVLAIFCRADSAASRFRGRVTAFASRSAGIFRTAVTAIATFTAGRVGMAAVPANILRSRRTASASGQTQRSIPTTASRGFPFAAVPAIAVATYPIAPISWIRCRVPAITSGNRTNLDILRSGYRSDNT